ncbi:glutamyl-tRNA reductase [Agromyces sp. MMS24-K17]|uniref:glutamyl-tRNA reductase n=1 Tax=Agromyces sp. MMS24-K17 TaxID=3372850 RepID=UPI003754E372
MLICLTASHKNAGFDLLERLSATADDAGRRMLAGHDAVAGAVVVATCNRFEAYLDLSAPEGSSPVPAVHEAIRAVGEVAGLEPDELRTTFGFAHGNAVATHLFSVAAGLESVVVGEGEIAGQVRRSLEQARTDGTTTPELERLFQRASQTSRKVKTRTGIGRQGRSLVRLALDLAESRITDWAQVRVLLVGTGQYAGASLAALRERGVTDVSVHSPSGRAAKFARSHDLPAVAHEDYARTAAAADLIVTCTTVDEHVVDRALLADGRERLAREAELPTIGAGASVGSAASGSAASALAPEVDRRQLVIDLGLPRNVAPDVTELIGVELLDLETIKIHAPIEELASTEEARRIVSRAARNFGAVGEELDLAPTVVALRSHVFDLLDGEIERARARGDVDGRVEEALRHMAGRLLHTPMVRSRSYARAGEQQAFIEAVEALFGVTAAPADGATGTSDAAFQADLDAHRPDAEPGDQRSASAS